MASVMDNICFTAEVNCLSFHGHMLKANMCTNCMKDIAKHSKDSVTEDDLVKALEHTQKGEKVPSVIIKGDENLGALYLGGFKAVLNTHFIKNENVSAIVNTVGSGLFKLFGRKFESNYHEVINDNNLSCLFLEWEDSISYDISDEDLKNVIKHIHKSRLSGGGVIVHCAQGKSRSTTAVVAYLMTTMSFKVHEALMYVQERRKMAEPNAHFMYLLDQFEKSDLLKLLQKELQLT